jgi:CHASE3 domain sensor protein
VRHPALRQTVQRSGEMVVVVAVVAAVVVAVVAVHVLST